MPYSIQLIASSSKWKFFSLELASRLDKILREFFDIYVSIGVFIPTLSIVNMSEET